VEISKLVIPTASPGSRFLPFTKTISKEMLPLLNKPLIQYLAEEALQSEINNLFIITGKGKNSLIDHFDASAKDESSMDPDRKSVV
jgi:UTP--glucose-1-phosphate uridylyltransferase